MVIKTIIDVSIIALNIVNNNNELFFNNKIKKKN